MKRRHLVLYAKAPLRGLAKRRLARDIGWREAMRFYRASLTGAVRRFGGDPRWRSWLAVTPDHPGDDGPWPPGIDRLAQGRGDLGRRMAGTLGAFGHDAVLIVGCDVPAATPAMAARAFALLGRHDAVLCPAPDGGYWAIGWAGRRPFPRRGLDGIAWSTATARADTIAALAPATVALGDAVEDVDDGAAFRRWRAAMRTGREGTER